MPIFLKSVPRIPGDRWMSRKFWIALAIVNFSLMIVIAGLLLWEAPRRDETMVRVVEMAPDMVRGDIFVPTKYREMLEYWCEQENVPFNLMARIAQCESNWNPNATNGKDHGLFQLNTLSLDYFQWKFNDNVPVDPYNPEIATKIACKYVAALYEICGDYRLVVASYNAGYRRITEEGLPVSTSKYLDKVFGYRVDVF
jgi:uncharacterized protein YjeT (DUF2065 family)